MNQPIVFTADSTGEATLRQARPEADDSGGDLVKWTLDFDVGLEEGATGPDATFPALDAYVNRATEGNYSTELTVTPRTKAAKGVRVTVDAAGEWADEIEADDGAPSTCVIPAHGGTLSFVKGRLTKDSQSQRARLVLPGVPAVFSNRICRAIGKRVAVTIEANQVDLFEDPDDLPPEAE